MSKTKWSLLLAFFVIASGPYCGSEDEDDQPSNNGGQAGATVLPYQCPDGTVQNTTSSGKVICCSANNAQFCDENAEGYTGGCWPEGTNCDAITMCGGQWTACPPASLPYCHNDQLQCIVCSENSSVYYSASGKPFCCDAEFPTFCDETDQGYEGGCWQAGVDCQTMAQCGDTWTACASGMVVVCDAATGQSFCTQN